MPIPESAKEQLSTIFRSLGYTPNIIPPNHVSSTRWETRYNLYDDHLVQYLDLDFDFNNVDGAYQMTSMWITKWATVPADIFFRREDKVSYGKYQLPLRPFPFDVTTAAEADSLRNWITSSWDVTFRNTTASWFNLFKMLDSRRSNGEAFGLEKALEVGKVFQVKAPKNEFDPGQGNNDGKLVRIVNYKEVLPRINGDHKLGVRGWRQTVIPFISDNPSIPSVYLKEVTSDIYHCLPADWLCPETELAELQAAAEAGTLKLRDLTPFEEELHRSIGLLAPPCQCSTKDLMRSGCQCGAPK